ncbi:guanine nucleotide binding protein, alpha subunit [Gorgonomyces haynaldii]|nr:guanine nucleotide binding protein, alpha subunit [Gorgonomyces haynaldii]
MESPTLSRIQGERSPKPRDSLSVRQQIDMETPEQRRHARRISNQIDMYLKQEAIQQAQTNHITLLLLGSGGSGKSTVLKQLQLNFSQGYNTDHLQHFKTDIHHHILLNSKVLVKYQIQHQIPFPTKEVEELCMQLLQMDQRSLISPEMGKAIDSLYRQAHVKDLFEKWDQVGLDDNTDELLDKILDITQEDYIPDTRAILLCRRKTEHISETVLDMQDSIWHVIDVAGQRDKRAKWAVYFEHATNLIYVFSGACYNQTLEEDILTNRLQDSIELFESLITHPILRIPAAIVFMNKTDILSKKIEKFPIADYYKPYKGPNTKQAWTQFMATVFKDKGAAMETSVYFHSTTATDTELMKKILIGVRKTIIGKALRNLHGDLF